METKEIKTTEPSEKKENPERKFLHDISTPLTAVQLNLDIMQSLLLKGDATSLEQCKKMAEKSLTQTKKMSAMIRSRREVLIQEQEK